MMFTKLKRRTVTVSAAVAACGAATVLFAAGPAAAVPANYITVKTTNNGGLSAFNDQRDASKEIFNACDHTSDGMRAVGILKFSGRTYEVHDAGGADGNCVARTDVNVPEGTAVTLTVCLRDGANGANQYCRTASSRG
ncbi:hypothetical protein ACWENA_04850 [Streptomyces sp. NPDC004779]